MSERALAQLLVIPTAIVALVLGILLYRSNNQVSESTSVRLADSLQMSMTNWHLNFYRDLSDVAGALRVDSENSANLDLYARRFREWTTTAQYRDLVLNLYVLKANETTPQALRLELDDYMFKAVDWPQSLEPLSRQLSEIPQASSAKPLAFFPRGLAGWKFAAEPMALVRPIDSLPGSWLVVELDKRVIQSRILPDLAKRYFTGVDGLDYLLAVVSGKHEVVYSSDHAFGGEEVADADGRLDVFGNQTAQQFGSPLYVFHPLSEHAGMPPFTGSLGSQWFPLLNETANAAGWQLIVRHRRGGALGAFVSETRRRNLAISFGVLFLLIGMVAVLIVTSLRANRLAQLQMDFVTAVSHELRSPLTIIGSAAENITQGVVNTRERIDQYAKIIEVQTHQLSRLVEGVLLFAATREKHERYAYTTLKVSAIVDAALAATTDLIEAAQFVVERDVPADLPKVRGDLSALSQCLQNLITNALKYSGDSRWIGIRASVHDDGGGARKVRIAVADRGMGIAPRDLPRIFEPFFRSASATNAQIHGTGLGLSLAKNIAEAMHGQLTVVSQPGSGATFTLHLRALPDGTVDSEGANP